MNAVTQLNDAILELLNRLQIQGHMAVTPRDQWNAIAYEHRGHSDHELVDRVRIEKGRDQLPTTH